MKQPIFYVDGQFVHQDQAKISVLDLGLLRGYAIFEYVRTYQGKPFHFHDHMKRMLSTLEQVHLTCPASLDEIESIINTLLDKNHFSESGIKVIVTGGQSSDQLFPDQTPNFMVLVNHHIPYPEVFYEEGIKVITTPFIRPYAHAKTLQYLPAIVALKEARQKNAFDVIFVGPENQLLESGSANFFAFKGDTLITPTQDVLPGITQKIVLNLAKPHFAIETRQVDYDEIHSFDGAFFTATNKEVMPIVQIDSVKIGDGTIPDNVKLLMQLFQEYTCLASWATF